MSQNNVFLKRLTLNSKYGIIPIVTVRRYYYGDLLLQIVGYDERHKYLSK